MKFPLIFSVLLVNALTLMPMIAADSLVPYSAGEVPQNVVDLWEDVDVTADPLDVKVIKEWVEDEVVCRYVMFTVGTFKGEVSRIAAFYTFPEGAEDAPAIVWAHGGGQRAELDHGKYVATHGYAMVDINWGGREILEGIEENTDWGAIDPSQGPKFYPGAKRNQSKQNLLPDEFTIDPVVSPRNGNWFMLAYAGRRAITFLEQQPEVDPEKIGFTGFSMGGNITSYVSFDPRLKAVVPMVGGAGFITSDSPGLPDSGMAKGYKDHVELFAKTTESQSYYPHTECPVLLLSATDDFHSRFEFIYQCMDALPHDNWRVSQKMHLSHNLGPEQWILMNRWFDKYLKGESVELANTAETTLSVNAEEGNAVFEVTPNQPAELEALEIYYTHDPNPKSRFWIHAESEEKNGVWTAVLPLRDELPLYAFANCTYPLDQSVEAFQGIAENYTLSSTEGVYLPESINADRLFEEATELPVLSDIEKDGFLDWGMSSRGGLHTYKFRDPRAKVPDADAVMKVTVNPPRLPLSYRFRLGKNRYIHGVKEPQVSYSKSFEMKETGEQVLLLKSSDFLMQRTGTPMADWANITTFNFDVYDGAAKSTLHFSEELNRDIIQKIEWVTE